MSAENHDHEAPAFSDGGDGAQSDALREQTPANASHDEARMRAALSEFRRDLREHPVIRKLERRRAAQRWTKHSFSRISRIALAFGSSAAAVVLVAILLMWRSATSSAAPAWAEVVQEFRSVSFFCATIYLKQGALDQPKETELWLGHGGRARVRTGPQVIFAQNGNVTKAFDVQSRMKTTPEPLPLQLLKRLGSKPEFSLDAVLNFVTGGRVTEETHTFSAGTPVAKELVVFDIQSSNSPEWLRVWALTKSRLPVRMRLWDPRNGGCVDAFFSYTKDQPDDFFDPEAFERQLQSPASAGEANRAYAALADPAGRKITPRDMFKESGYHLPIVESAGISPEGAAWIVASRSMNRRPDGGVFYGFQRLDDDLGRVYYWASGFHRAAEDRSVQIFVPEEYPFDDRVPKILRLTCTAEPTGENKEGHLIGKIETSEWMRGQRWPADADAKDPIIGQAWRLCHAGAWASLNRILAVMVGDPATDPVALAREQIRVAALVRQGNFAEATTSGAQLMVFLERSCQDASGKSASIFNDYIVAVAGAGRITQAHEILQRVERLITAGHTDQPAASRERMLKRCKDDYDRNLEHLAQQLSSTAKLSVDRINQVLGVDVRTDRRFVHTPAFQPSVGSGGR